MEAPIDILTQATVALALVLILGPMTFWILDPLFSLLNTVQHILERPHRPLLKKPSRALRPLYLALLPARFAAAAALYVCSFPLRLLNGIYYDLYVLNLAMVRDALAELLLPRRGEARRLKGSAYLSHWIIGLPGRLLASLQLVLWGLLDGVAMLFVDLIFPTLTMYHGTSFPSAVSITQPGAWVVGPGNFAGTGVYFAMRRSVAEHYASGGVVICARVTLGNNYPLSCAPRLVREAVGRDGDAITHWGLRHGITSTEHWRGDHGGWWEYCLLRGRHNPQEGIWRIRPLYVAGVGRRFPARIWGGKRIWLRDDAAIRVVLASVALTLIASEVLLTLLPAPWA
jgi:hypothetical protein